VVGRKMRVFGMGKVACDPGAVIRRLGKCRAIKVKDGGAAFDGDTCTVWNAGAPPTQAIGATVETADRIDAMILVPEMTPAKGHAVHAIEIFGPASGARKYVADAPFATNEAYLLVFDPAANVEKVRVVTTESPSWVAWREIVLVACDEPVTVPAGTREVTPIPPRRIIAGTGACTTDADCARETCCGPRTCTARRNAPQCNGVGCGQSYVAGEMTESTARCVCDRGACGAWFFGPRGLQ
jgi:hypothetical protein